MIQSKDFATIAWLILTFLLTNFSQFKEYIISFIRKKTNSS